MDKNPKIRNHLYLAVGVDVIQNPDGTYTYITLPSDQSLSDQSDANLAKLN